MPAQTVTEAKVLQYIRLAWISQLTNLKRHQNEFKTNHFPAMLKVTRSRTDT